MFLSQELEKIKHGDNKQTRQNQEHLQKPPINKIDKHKRIAFHDLYITVGLRTFYFPCNRLS